MHILSCATCNWTTLIGSNFSSCLCPFECAENDVDSCRSFVHNEIFQVSRTWQVWALEETKQVTGQ